MHCREGDSSVYYMEGGSQCVHCREEALHSWMRARERRVLLCSVFTRNEMELVMRRSLLKVFKGDKGLN